MFDRNPRFVVGRLAMVVVALLLLGSSQDVLADDCDPCDPGYFPSPPELVCGLCEDRLVGHTDGPMPSLPSVELKVDWGDQGAYILVYDCGDISPAKGTVIARFPGLSDPNYSLTNSGYDDWAWNNCQSPDGPNEPFPCGGEGSPYSPVISHVVDCEPNDVNEKYFDYPTCDSYSGGTIIVSLNKCGNLCDTLRAVKGKNVTVNVEAYAQVRTYQDYWGGSCDGSNDGDFGPACVCTGDSCYEDDEDLGRFIGRVYREEYSVGIKFEGENPCK